MFLIRLWIFTLVAAPVAVSFLLVGFMANGQTQPPTKQRTHTVEHGSPEENIDRGNLPRKDRFRGFYRYRPYSRLPEGMMRDVPDSGRFLILPYKAPLGSPAPNVPNNIAPYRNALIKQAISLVPVKLQKGEGSLILVIDKAGNALKAEFITENNKNKSLAELESKTEQILRDTRFSSLPPWYENEALPICISFGSRLSYSASMEEPRKETYQKNLNRSWKRPISQSSQQSNRVDTREPIFDRSKLYGPSRFRDYPSEQPIPAPPGSVLDAPLVVPGSGSASITPIGGSVIAGPAVGNIGPYRKKLLLLLAPSSSKAGKQELGTVILKIARDGTLLDTEVIDDNKTLTDTARKQLLKTIENTKFPPLPDWFCGPSLTFKMTISACLESSQKQLHKFQESSFKRKKK